MNVENIKREDHIADCREERFDMRLCTKSGSRSANKEGLSATFTDWDSSLHSWRRGLLRQRRARPLGVSSRASWAGPAPSARLFTYGWSEPGRYTLRQPSASSTISLDWRVDGPSRRHRGAL